MPQFNILSINFNHDGSATIVSNGKIKAYINTERFSKKKKHPGIRREDLFYLLDQANMELTDINQVLLCNIHNMDTEDIPLLYGTDMKETWIRFWVNQLMNRVMIDGHEIPCMINPDHQTLHSALAYFTSDFEEAICFSWDPTGYAAFVGKKNKLVKLDYRLRGPNTCNWYSNVATHLFGTGIVGAGKVMGLAPYGAPSNKIFGSPRFSSLEKLYDYSHRHQRVISENGKKLNASLAWHVQQAMELQLSRVLYDLHHIALEQGIEPNICLSGGGALNSVANQVAFERSKFEQMHIHPASGDDGTAIGAALWYWYDVMNNERKHFSNREKMYSVASYDHSIEEILAKPAFRNRIAVDRGPDYIGKTARYIAANKIVGWFQESSEMGPRSLGNRSILANACHPDMRQILNSKVKFREGFRPFAPSVLNEHAEEWFGLKDSPFMLRVCKVLKEGIPSVTHVDKTARIQTVSEKDNPNFYRLIKSFYDITGVPLIINTSFNIKGEPIVETPEDAINCFLNTEIDVLVFKNMILEKKNEPAVLKQAPDMAAIT